MRVLRLILGWSLIAIGCASPLGFVVIQGINDGEWRKLNYEGGFSSPQQVEWTAWLSNLPLIATVMIPSETKLPQEKATQFRRGIAHGMIFDFTLYECRDDTGEIAPAIGPDWGAAYHPLPGAAALLVGAAVIFLPAIFRLRVRTKI